MNPASITAATPTHEDLKWFEEVQDKSKTYLSTGGLRTFLATELVQSITGDSAWRVAALLDNSFRGRLSSVEVRLSVQDRPNANSSSMLEFAAWSKARESVKILFDRTPSEPSLINEGDRDTDPSIGGALSKLINDGDADLVAHALRSAAYKDLGKYNDVVVEIRDRLFKSGKADLVKAAALANPAILDPSITRWASTNDHLFGTMNKNISRDIFDTVLELRGATLGETEYRQLLNAAVDQKDDEAALKIIKAGGAAFDLAAEPSPLLYAAEKDAPVIAKALIGDAAAARRLSQQSAASLLAFAVDKGAQKVIAVMLDLLPLTGGDIKDAYAKSLRLNPVTVLLSDFIASGKAGQADQHMAGIASAAASVKKAVVAPERAAFRKREKFAP